MNICKFASSIAEVHRRGLMRYASVPGTAFESDVDPVPSNGKSMTRQGSSGRAFSGSECPQSLWSSALSLCNETEILALQDLVALDVQLADRDA